MTLTYNFGTSPAFGFKETLDLLATGIYGGTIVQQDTTTYQITNGGNTYTFSGTGFTYGSISGQTFLFGGTIDSISMDQSGALLGEMTGIAMPSAALTSAFLDEFFGFDPLAMETLFLTQDYVFNGTNDAQILTIDQTTSDGVPYPPSGNDTAYLFGGDDIFDLGLGDDSLFGGSGSDTLYGNEGNDVVQGGTGKDWLFGGNGNDYMTGDGSADRMFGGDGADEMHGGSSADYMEGQSGKDKMYGDGGNDIMFGGTGGGTDSLYGGEGHDQLYGGNQKDKLWGDAGNDTLNGDLGNDRLFGGDGDDHLNGGTDDDRMFGDNGADRLDGGIGDDRMYGGAGADVFVFNASSGRDDIRDYDVTQDRLELTGSAITGMSFYADHTVIAHDGGSITLADVVITTTAEFNDLLATIDFL